MLSATAGALATTLVLLLATLPMIVLLRRRSLSCASSPRLLAGLVSRGQGINTGAEVHSGRAAAGASASVASAGSAAPASRKRCLKAAGGVVRRGGDQVLALPRSIWTMAMASEMVSML